MYSATTAPASNDLKHVFVLALALILFFASIASPVHAQITDDTPTTDTPSGSYCPQLTSTFQRGASDGSTGGQVTQLQRFLTDHFDINSQNIVVGEFGKITQNFVIRFQQEQGLPAYGLVGSLTRAAIARECQGVPTATGNTTTTTTSNANPDRAHAIESITALYQSELQRAPDQAGLDYYVNQYLAGGITLAQIKQTLINSKTPTPTAPTSVVLNSWGYNITCSASSVVQGGNISATISGGNVSDNNWVTVYRASDTSSHPGTFGAAGFAPTAHSLSSMPETVTFNVPANALGVYEIRLQTLNGFVRAGSCSFAVTPAPVVANTATPVVTTTTSTQTPVTTTASPSITQQVTALYQSVFGRAPDSAGLNYWVGQVASGAATLSYVERNFAAVRDITALYQSELQRAPDQAGLDYYVNQYLAGGITLAQIRQTLINSRPTQSCPPSAVSGTYPNCICPPGQLWNNVSCASVLPPTPTPANVICSAGSVASVALGGNISATVPPTTVNDWVGIFRASETSSSNTLIASGFSPGSFAGSGSAETRTISVRSATPGSYQLRLQTPQYNPATNTNGFATTVLCTFTVVGSVSTAEKIQQIANALAAVEAMLKALMKQ